MEFCSIRWSSPPVCSRPPCNTPRRHCKSRYRPGYSYGSPGTWSSRSRVAHSCRSDNSLVLGKRRQRWQRCQGGHGNASQLERLRDETKTYSAGCDVSLVPRTVLNKYFAASSRGEEGTPAGEEYRSLFGRNAVRARFILLGAAGLMESEVSNSLTRAREG